MKNQPRSWDDAVKLSQNETELREAMRIRLIHLGFSQDNATAIRAFELLREMASQTIEDDFSDIRSEILEEIRERARRFIAESAFSANGRENDDD